MRYLRTEEMSSVSGGQDTNIYIYGDVYTAPFIPGPGCNPCNGPIVPPVNPLLPTNPSFPPNNGSNGPLVPPMP